MVYEVRYSKQAQKYLQKLQPAIARKIYLYMHEISIGQQYNKNTAKLSGYENYYRLRIGKFRVVFEKCEDILIIRVIEINSRGDIYKNI